MDENEEKLMLAELVEGHLRSIANILTEYEYQRVESRAVSLGYSYHLVLEYDNNMEEEAEVIETTLRKTL